MSSLVSTSIQKSSSPVRRPGLTARVASRPALWLALVIALIVGVLAAPSVTFLLPNTESMQVEDYQPLKTLKFFKNRGQSYHKYGPMTNFVLAPGYGASLAWWQANKDFENPNETFPYGLKRPLEQMTMLILQGRALFLVLGLLAIVWLMFQARLMTHSLGVLFAGGALLIATAPFLAQRLVVTRPDSLLFTFLAICLGLYLKMLYLGFSRGRVIAFAVFVICAITSKEIAGTILILPVLGVLWLAIRGIRAGAFTAGSAFVSLLLAAIIGVAVYALLNVVYAPDVWLERMKFWLYGWNPSEIWSNGIAEGTETRLQVAGEMATEILSHLGVGGSLVTLIALPALILFRPSNWLLLLLPLLGYIFLSMVPLGYVPQPQYFITLPALLLLPVVAGLAAIRNRLTFSGAGATTSFVIIGLLVLDSIHATFAWHGLNMRYHSLVHTYISENVDKQTRFGELMRRDAEPNRRYFDFKGYNFDRRGVGSLLDATDPEDRPEIMIVERGLENWLNDAKGRPARAELIRREDGIDIAKWNGVEALGYRLDTEIIARTPRWYPFDFMRRIRWFQQQRSVRVYVRT